MLFAVSRVSWSALAGVALAHVGAMVWLAHSTPSVTAPTALPSAPALMVEMIASPSKPVPPSPSAPIPAARSVQPVPATAPVLATKPDSASPATAVPTTVPDAPKSASPSHAAVPAAPATPATPNAPAAAPSVPRFDADYLNNPTPAYPPLSRRLREEGKVVLRVLVEPSGAAGTVEMRTSSGFERLDKSAISAVSRWKFVPAKQGNEAVGAWVLVPIVFSLKD